jgi:thiol-disulfide isomerase/thioredoxin
VTTARRPNILLLVLAAIVVLAVAAVVVSQAGGDDDSSSSNKTSSSLPETRDVAVSGTPLPQLGDAADDPAIGAAAPVVTGEAFDGSKVSIGTGPSLLVFVAHWCPHCQREVPFLVSYFEEHGMPEGVDVYGVATGVDPASPNFPPSAWLDREHWTVPTLVDSADSTTARAYGLSAYPYFVALDKDGEVAARGSGELEAPQLEALFEAARS